MLKIISPMFTGNGAHVVHESLASWIPDYQLISLSPRWQYFPVALPFLQNRTVDILHAMPDYATFFRSRCRKMCLTFQNFVLDQEMRSYSSPLQYLHYQTDLKWFVRRAIIEADIITAVSQSTARLVRDTMKYRGDVEVIYNGVDTAKFIPESRRRKVGEFRIMFSGNLTRRKGAHLLPGIADKLSGNSIIYYTGGLKPGNLLPSHPRLRSLGSVTHDKIPEIYRQMDALLFPSFREGCSLAVLEAMASGLPVVTSDCSSMPEQITEGLGGYLCKPADEEAFASQLNRLSNETELCRRMGEYNRSRVEAEFSLELMLNKYSELFEKLSV